MKPQTTNRLKDSRLGVQGNKVQVEVEALRRTQTTRPAVVLVKGYNNNRGGSAYL